MHLNRVILAATAAMLVSLAPASAATINLVINFSADSFVPAAPSSPVTGSIALTFDPDADYLESSAGISLNSLSIAHDGAIGFNFNHTTGSLYIGGLLHDVQGLGFDTNDFILHLFRFPSGQVLLQSLDTSVANVGFFRSDSLTALSGPPTPPVAATPLPAGLPLLAAALLALAGLGFRGKRCTRPIAAARV